MPRTTKYSVLHTGKDYHSLDLCSDTGRDEKVKLCSVSSSER